MPRAERKSSGQGETVFARASIFSVLSEDLERVLDQSQLVLRALW